MRRRALYRFGIINSCDIVESYTATALFDVPVDNETEISFSPTPHNLNVGDWVSLTGFAPNGSNIITQVTSGTPMTAGIGIKRIPGMDLTVLGTVHKLTGKRTVTPLNFFQSKFDWEHEGDEIFFRKLFQNPLRFEKEDFNYFRNYILPNECCEIKFVIEKQCSGLGFATEDDAEIVTENEWNTEWEGMFTHNSCEWNLSHCWVEAKFELDDFYRCLLYGYEDPQTVFETLTYFERLECCEDRDISVLPAVLPCSAPCNSVIDALQDNGSGGISFDDDFIVDPCDDFSSRGDWQLELLVITQTTFTGGPFQTFHLCCTWIREVAITMDDVNGDPVPPAGSGWVQRLRVNYNELPAHKWTRIPYNAAYYNFADYTVVRDCAGMPCVRTWTVNFPDTIDSSTNSKSLEETMSLLIGLSCAKITGFRSDFFEINAPADTPGYVAGTNYVTGAASQILNLRIKQVSAFISTLSNTNVAEIYSDLSLKNTLDALKIIFNCKWFIDSDGYVRMEHISWFGQTTGRNSTTGYNGQLNKSRNHFKFDRQNIPLREDFSFVYQGYKDFIGLPIKYESPCVNVKHTVKYDVPKFSTDIQNIRDNANDFRDFNSFLLFACDVNNNTLEEAGLLTGSTLPNAHLSWANLHYNYHRHYRYLDSGLMNDTLTAFLSVRKLKRQSNIKYNKGCCVNIDPLTEYITTEIGNGEIDKMEKTNRDELWNFELLY